MSLVAADEEDGMDWGEEEGEKLEDVDDCMMGLSEQSSGPCSKL